LPGRDAPRLLQAYIEITMIPGQPSATMIREIYGVAHAEQVVRAAMADYMALYGQQSAEASSLLPMKRWSS
jgi:hypothetical protein